LGGNFALRLAWQHGQQPLPNLGQTITISPLIHGYQASLTIDQGPAIYLYYFRRRWREWLQQKQALFPERYDFSEELAASTCLGMHEAFVRLRTPYPDVQTYFQSYAVTPEMMQTLTTPLSIIAAADDPIIPISDIEPLAGVSPHLTLHRQAYGGHVGFMHLFPFRIWLCEAVEEILDFV